LNAGAEVELNNMILEDYLKIKLLISESGLLTQYWLSANNYANY